MWSCFWKMGWNVFVFKIVIFLTVQISLEEEADLMFLRDPPKLISTTGCIPYGDHLTVSWTIYLETYQSLNIRSVPVQPASAQMLQHPSSTTCFSFVWINNGY